MCGIVGYIGKHDALPILIEGIRSLEYRGYDSAGIAMITPSGIFSSRAVGPIKNLEATIGANPPKGIAGIIHCRWATHGGVTEANAHPHADCAGNIFVVHNGIIENYQELRTELIIAGHRFRSETDTEVLAHLFEMERAKNLVASLDEVVRQALTRVRGAYGIAVIDQTQPGTLVAVRNFSPLLVGVGNGEYFIASDVAAILKYTTSVVYLDDGEMVIMTPEGYRVKDLKNNLCEKKLTTVEWSLEEAQKGGHPHFMIKEIQEQSTSIENSLRGRIMVGQGNAKLGGLSDPKMLEVLRQATRIHIVGCGTAYFAGRVGEYMLEEYAGIPVETDIGSEFRYRKPVFREGDILLAISQSGETADTLAAVREAKEKGVPTFGIVNVVGSSIARATGAGVYQHIGPEIGVASTKAFTSQVAILALWTLLLGRQRDMSLVMGIRIARELADMPQLVKKVLEQEEAIKQLAQKYHRVQNFFYLGRKYNMAVAHEGALKLKEISYIHAEGYAAGELKHGSIALIDENFPSWCIAPQDSVYEKMISNIAEIKARYGPVLAIATEGDTAIKEIADHVVYIPKTLEMLTPILATIPLQLFAYHVAVLRGASVDQPRNLAKSVTVE